MSSPQSPPTSQTGTGDAMMIDSQTAPSHDISEVPASGASVPPIIALQVATSSTNTGVNGSEASTHGDPGSTWNGKKFREEYDKAFNDLLDQTWTMAQYGDPLLRK